MIDVSIVLTVYNAESYIEGCLDMITGQTLRNIQIICVDDGSTDNSSQIIEQYAQKDDRIVLMREECRSGCGKKPWNAGGNRKIYTVSRLRRFLRA